MALRSLAAFTACLVIALSQPCAAIVVRGGGHVGTGKPPQAGQVVITGGVHQCVSKRNPRTGSGAGVCVDSGVYSHTGGAPSKPAPTAVPAPPH